mmetsp:Transcript_4919/g.7176  ORF Transcript_4919/g.7176 Transcript_4919/m.7176 type:complete len:217 (-) Transcript_4919:54-704(-)
MQQPAQSTSLTSVRNIRGVTGPLFNKDARSFRPRSLADIHALEHYKPLALQFKREDGSVCCECPIGCGNSLEDILIIFTCYITLYSFLIGSTSLLLKFYINAGEAGAIILWMYLFAGVMFVLLVVLHVKLGQMERERADAEKERQKEQRLKQILSVPVTPARVVRKPDGAENSDVVKRSLEEEFYSTPDKQGIVSSDEASSSTALGSPLTPPDELV